MGLPTVFDLSTLDGQNGFSLYGTVPYASLYSSGTIGDINHDGFDDVVVNHPSAAHDGQFDVGSIYLIFGGAHVGAAGQYTLPDLLTNSITIRGIDQHDRAGIFVSDLGDVNGDRIDDFMISASMGNSDGNGIYGENYIIFGRDDWSQHPIDLANLNGTNGFVVHDANVGRGGSGLGDINGDGWNDLIINSFAGNFFELDDTETYRGGQAYVIFGSPNIGQTGHIYPTDLTGQTGFVIDKRDRPEMMFSSVAGAGDVNQDGFDDVMIGSAYAWTGGEKAGRAYVIFGGAAIGSSGNFDLSTITTTNQYGFWVPGVHENDYCGTSVDGAGDLNGDGFVDVVINAPGANQVYVIYGRAQFTSSFVWPLNIDNVGSFVIHSSNHREQLTGAAHGVGDVNGDGVDDLLVGVSRTQASGALTSQIAYLIYGGTQLSQEGRLDLATLDDSRGVRFVGAPIGQYPAAGGQSAGDLNGDGLADLIFTAQTASYNGLPEVGANMVVFGRAMHVPSASADWLVGTVGSDRIHALAGDDVVRGMGGDDRLFGDEGHDHLSGGTGYDYLSGGAGRDALFGNDGNDRLLGGDQDDQLNGGRGNDRLFGEAGRDRLDGSSGNDVITTGTGQDVVVLRRGGGCDRITDFRNGSDRLDLVNLRLGQLTLQQRGDDLWISLGQEDLLRIDHMAVRQFDRSDIA